jgi:succinate dehydrogenase / fumarate reductase flavoprotein subunit
MMQCLADGYFIVPHTVTNHLAQRHPRVDAAHPAFEEAEIEVRERIEQMIGIGGRTAPQVFHRELGNVMLDKCGMSRTAEGLTEAISDIHRIRDAFWSDLRVDGRANELNQSLEYAGRVADFLELAELMCLDALKRNESAGGHFRDEYQTEDGEALRDDDQFATVTAWEYGGERAMPVAHEESLAFENVKLATRSYK